MGVFDKPVKKNLDIENSGTKSPDFVPNDIWNKIPDDIKDVLLFTDEIPKAQNHTGLNSIDISFDGKDFKAKYKDHILYDPSTIYFRLPLAVPKDISLVAKLPYYPSYAGMKPEQRYIYLNWLQDISQDIDVGYKFVFYYGLEKILFFDNYEKAFDMIVKLRNNTDDGSLKYYAENALFYTTIQSEDETLLDKLIFLFDEPKWLYNKQIFLKFFKHEPIEPNELAKLLKSFDVNKRYLNDLVYIDQMGELLSDKYGHSFLLPQDLIDKDITVNEDVTVFANISIPSKIRIRRIAMPDLTNFKTSLVEMHKICHEQTKVKLAALRKKK